MKDINVFMDTCTAKKFYAFITDKTPETTEQTKINISPFSLAMIMLKNKCEMEDNANAGN